MRIKLSLKTHFFGFAIFYLVVLLSVFSSFAILAHFNIVLNIYYVFLFLGLAMFSIFAGVYEYRIVSYTYLNVHPNPTTFWFHSLIMNLFNTLLCTSLLLFTRYLAFVFYDGLNWTFPYEVYIIIAIIFFFIFAASSLTYTLVHNIKLLPTISFATLLVALVFFGDVIKNSIFAFVSYIFDNANYLFYYSFLVLFIAIVLEILILLKINKSNK